jgi:hypothetical protein
MQKTLIQGESLEKPVKAMVKAGQSSMVPDDSEQKTRHDTVKCRE